MKDGKGVSQFQSSSSLGLGLGSSLGLGCARPRIVRSQNVRAKQYLIVPIQGFGGIWTARGAVLFQCEGGVPGAVETVLLIIPRAHLESGSRSITHPGSAFLIEAIPLSVTAVSPSQSFSSAIMPHNAGIDASVTLVPRRFSSSNAGNRVSCWTPSSVIALSRRPR